MNIVVIQCSVQLIQECRQKILLMLVIASFTISCFAQSTFNHRYHFDRPVAIGNNLFPTDSCIYFSGLALDTLPLLREGLLFGKLSLENGEILSDTLLFDSVFTLENWLTPFTILPNGHFLSTGYGYDSIGMAAYWIELSLSSEIIQRRFFRSYYAPEDYFIRPEDNILSADSSSVYVLAWIGIGPSGDRDFDYSIIKTNTSGDLIWQKKYGSNWYDFPTSLIQRGQELIMGARKTNKVQDIQEWDIQSYTQLEAIDTSGQILWTWQSENALQAGARDMLAKPDKSLVICGMRGSMYPVNPSIEHLLWDRGLIFELDSNRNVVWETEMRTPLAIRDNKLNHLVPASDGEGYVAAGNIGVPEEDALLGWLVKVSAQGDSLWSRYLRSYDVSDSLQYWHEVSDLQVTSDGGYIITGRSSDYEQLVSPITQAWFIKVDEYGCLNPGCQLVDTEEVTEEGPPLSVYPNPARDQLQVYIGATGGRSWQLALYDQQGRRLRSYEAPTDHTTYMLPVYDLPAGAYWLQVMDDSGRRVRTVPWVKGN